MSQHVQASVRSFLFQRLPLSAARQHTSREWLAQHSLRASGPAHRGRSQQKHLPSFTCIFATSHRKNTPSPRRHPNRLEESQSSSRTCSWRAESDTCGEDDFSHVGLILGTCQVPSCNLMRRIWCPNSRPSSDRPCYPFVRQDLKVLLVYTHPGYLLFFILVIIESSFLSYEA